MLLNLAFLLLIILLPITSDLFGTYGSAGDAVGLYAAHLAMISSANLVLWALAVAEGQVPGRPGAPWRVIAGPGFVAVIFGAATVVALWHTGAAQCLMFAAFLGPVVSQVLWPISRRPAAQHLSQSDSEPI